MQSPEAKRRKLMDSKDRGEGTSREQNPPFYLNQSQMAMLNFLQQQNAQNLPPQHQQLLHTLQQQYQAQQQHQHMMKQQQMMQVGNINILFCFGLYREKFVNYD